MNKKLFFAAAMALMCANASAQQVKVYDTGRKWNQEFDALIQGQNKGIANAYKSVTIW